MWSSEWRKFRREGHMGNPKEKSNAIPALVLPEILTAEQAAQLLQVDESTLYSWTRRRAKLASPLPFRHLGKFIRFEKSELLNWFMSLTPETNVGRPFGMARKASKKIQRKVAA